jgi:hypothetical protein
MLPAGAARRAALLLLAMAAWAPQAGAWGSGHHTQARMIMAVLPAEIRDFFPEDLQRKIILTYSMYPDTARTFDEALLGKAAVDELARVQKLTTGRLLHDDISIALAFSLLTRAFAEGNPQHAAVWLGSIIHMTGDDGSHLPLTAYMGPVSRFNIDKIGQHTDLSLTEATATGRDLLKQLMAGFTPTPMAKTPDEAISKLILLAYELMDVGAQRQSRIAGLYNTNAPADNADGLQALAELGAEEARQGARVVVTAWAFARQKQTVELNAALIKQAREKADAYVATKPLAHDTVYAFTLHSQPAGPAIGVVLEPSQFMGGRRFSYSGSVTLGQIMRTLRAAGIPYRPIDIRTVDREGLPPVTNVPAVIVVAGSFNTDPVPFRKYVDAGGRLLWIGGREKGLLGKLSTVLQPADATILPVSMTYGDVNTAVVARVSIAFTNDWQQELGPASFRFVNNPNLSDWVQPSCGLQLMASDPGIRMLATVTDGTKTMNLAGAWMEDGRARHVFMPEYLLVPFVLSHERRQDFTKPVLDSVGRKLLLTSVRLLVPDIARPKQGN